MTLTEEQEQIINYVKGVKGKELILVDSVAGSGKTTLLKGIANAVTTGQAIYLAYNKAIATSSASGFPKHVDCRTTHSLAYQATVKPMKLSVGFFGPKQIDEKIPYDEKVILADDIREFCLSRYLTYNEYAEENGRANEVLANKYLSLMSQGKIEVSHDFYLKLFHILLHTNQIEQIPYELVMLDEAGDLNEVTLEIFKLLSGRIKIAVGDPHQNIYTFNHTINCFDRLKDQGVMFRLSKSFRVPQHIAEPVEHFCKMFLNPSMQFKGVASSSSAAIVTRGYISRTNAGLIAKIIELNAERTPYGLVRKAQEIFKIPLMVAGLKYQGKIYDAAYKHIQEDADSWYENVNNVKTTNPSLLGYLKSKYADDIALSQAISLVLKYSKTGIFTAYAEAKEHENRKQNFMLLTAHSSKGLEFDEVILAPDMNTSLENIVPDLITNKQIASSDTQKEALNLYYVACTRALVSLKNASYLSSIYL